MSRPKSKHPDLPPYVTARESGGRLLYYWSRDRRTVALGADRAVALMRAADLSAAPLHKTVDFAEDLPAGMLHSGGGYFYVNAGRRVSLGRDRLEAIRTFMALAARDPKVAEADILSVQQILAISQPLVRLRGVYFLIAAEQIVYIGKAIDVHRRIEQHRAAGVQFDAWAFVPCDHDLEALERHYIRAIGPHLNTLHKRRFTN